MKVYIQDRSLLRKSKHHTVYLGEEEDAAPTVIDPRIPKKIYSITFVNGVADVDQQTYERFKRAGHCGAEAPNLLIEP